MAVAGAKHANTLLKVLLFVNLFYVNNQAHIPLETHIPAVAPVNMLFFLILLAMRGKPEPLQPVKPLLQRALLIFGGALTFAYLWGQLRAPGDFIVDLTYLKNALF